MRRQRLRRRAARGGSLSSSPMSPSARCRSARSRRIDSVGCGGRRRGPARSVDAADPRGRGSTRPCGRAGRRASRRRPGPPRRRPSSKQVGEDVVLEQARVEVAQDGQRRAPRDRPGATLGAVLLGRHGLERVDRPRAAESTSRARAYASLAPWEAKASRARAICARTGSSSRAAPSRSRATSRAMASAPSSLLPFGAPGKERERRGPTPSRPRATRRARCASSIAASPMSPLARARTRSSSSMAASGSASAARGRPQRNAEAAPGSRSSSPCDSGALRELERRARARRPRGPRSTRPARRHSVGESVGRQRVLDLLGERRRPRREQASRDGDVAPDQRLAVGEQALPGGRQRVALEDAQAVIVSLRRPVARLRSPPAR